MADRIEIKDLLIHTIIGIKDEERKNPQPVLINITLETDTRAAGRSDDISDAVNYRTITKQVIELVERSQYFLLEKMAQEIARVCLADQRVEGVKVSVEKPGAVRFSRSVGVTIERSDSLPERTMNHAYLALGSNINPRENMRAAVKELGRYGRIVAVSQVWETPPLDLSEGPHYLNASVWMETPFTASELCRNVIAGIERSLNRVRDPKNKNAPRTIDIDIAFFNHDILKIDHRRIPAPDILTRPFLAIPLAELNPDFVHPECGQTLAQIAKELKATSPTMQLRKDVLLTGQPAPGFSGVMK